jgi:hypothetical protein
MFKKVSKDVGFTNINKFMDKLEAFNMPKDVFKPTPFAGWAMSIMFFGMALQRTFDTIWKSSTKTFQDVMHSVEGTVTKFDILNGSMAYLGFTAGQALEPLVALILPIIDAAQEWIQNNEKLSADIVTVGAVMGAMFLVGGAGVLAFNGFKDMLTIIKGIPSSINEIKNADFEGIGNSIRTGVGAVVIAIGFMTTAEAIKDFFDSDEEGSLKNALKASGGILEMIGGMRILKGQKGGYIQLAVGLMLDELSKGTFFTAIMTLMGQIAGIIAGGLAEGFKQAIKLIEDSYNNSLAAQAFGKINISSTLPSFNDIYSTTVKGMNELGKDLDIWANAPLNPSTPVIPPYAGQFSGQSTMNNYYFNGYTSDDILKVTNANR